jgi:hypothetical protein
MGTALWEYWWQPTAGAREKLQTSALDAALAQGYWHISWDKFAGKSLTFMVSPDGQPLVGDQWTDENLDIYRDELRDAGVDPKQFERTVMVGDIKVEPLPGENVLLDPGAHVRGRAVRHRHREHGSGRGRSALAEGGNVGPTPSPATRFASPQSFRRRRAPEERAPRLHGYFRPAPCSRRVASSAGSRART